MGTRRCKIGGALSLVLLVAACLWGVAASSGLGAERGAQSDSSAVFDVVHDAVSGSGVQTKLKVKRCPTQVAISGGHARLPGDVAVRVPAHTGARLLAYAAVNGSVLPAPRKWDCTASLGVDGTETIGAGPPGSVVGKHGRSPHLRKGGESVQAELIPACEGCIATTICSFFPQADVVKVYESTLECDGRPNGELRFRLSRSAVLFVDPPGVKGASAQSGGPLPSIGVVSYKRATGARQFELHARRLEGEHLRRRDRRLPEPRSPRLTIAHRSSPERRHMNVNLLHPEGINRVPVHHQVSLAEGSKVVSLAGQVSWDAEGQLVGAGDLAAQAEQCYLNVTRALEAVGASTDDLTRITAYVVNLDPAKAEQVLSGREGAAEALGVVFQQPGTFVGVTSLFDPAYLIEVEATAVLA